MENEMETYIGDYMDCIIMRTVAILLRSEGAAVRRYTDAHALGKFASGSVSTPLKITTRTTHT